MVMNHFYIFSGATLYIYIVFFFSSLSLSISLYLSVRT